MKTAQRVYTFRWRYTCTHRAQWSQDAERGRRQKEWRGEWDKEWKKTREEICISYERIVFGLIAVPFVFCFPVCRSPPDVHSFLCHTTQTPTDKTMVCRPGDRLGSSFTCFTEEGHSPFSNCFCMSDDVTKIVRPISWFTRRHFNAKELSVYQKSSLHFVNVSDDVGPWYKWRICDVHWTTSRDFAINRLSLL